MAFKILNTDEIDLLHDHQKVQYEEELALYQQRAAFVEQLELLEQVNIEPFKPKLNPIDSIEGLEVKSFKKPEYIPTICEPAAKSNLKVRTFEKTELPKPVLPLFDKKQGIVINHIQKPNTVQPNLPSTAKPAVIVKVFERFETSHPDLPKLIKPDVKVRRYEKPEKMQPDLPLMKKPSMDMKIPLGQLNLNRQDMLNHMPAASMQEIDFRSFEMPPNDMISLPEVSILCKEMKPFHKPKQSNIELPAVVRPDTNMNSYQGVKLNQPELPQISDIGAEVRTTFRKPELSLVETQKVVKPNINVPYFNTEKRTKPKLPKLSEINVEVGNFIRPKHNKLDLPTAAKMNIEIKSFEKPAMDHPVLPAMVKIRMADKTFDQFKMVQPNVVVTENQCAPVKIFTKQERTIPKLPERNTVQTPDTDKKLAELFSVMNEEYHTLIG